MSGPLGGSFCGLLGSGSGSSLVWARCGCRSVSARSANTVGHYRRNPLQPQPTTAATPPALVRPDGATASGSWVAGRFHTARVRKFSSSASPLCKSFPSASGLPAAGLDRHPSHTDSASFLHSRAYTVGKAPPVHPYRGIRIFSYSHPLCCAALQVGLNLKLLDSIGIRISRCRVPGERSRRWWGAVSRSALSGRRPPESRRPTRGAPAREKTASG